MLSALRVLLPVLGMNELSLKKDKELNEQVKIRDEIDQFSAVASPQLEDTLKHTKKPQGFQDSPCNVGM